MKQLLLASFFLITLAVSAQDNLAIVGEWHVVSVDDGDVYWNNKMDSVSVTEKVKQSYPTKVGLQDRIAGVRLLHSHMRFLFDANNNYSQYQSDHVNSKLFWGSYGIDPLKKEITTDVTARTGIQMTKRMAYEIKDGFLYLTTDIHTHTNAKYVLEKVK